VSDSPCPGEIPKITPLPCIDFEARIGELTGLINRMKCDGPAQVPCRGCRASGQPCVFEARSRPKSISVIPSRTSISGPSFYPAVGRPPSSSGRSNTPTAFYPSGPIPAPPITTSSSSLSARLDRSREPMPPPPGASIASLTAPAPPNIYPSRNEQMIYHPPPLQLPPFSSNPLNMPGIPTGPGPGPPPPSTPSVTESRLRSIESGMRNLTTIPATLQNIELRLNYLQKGQDSLNARISSKTTGSLPDVSTTLKEAYTNRAWPLAPWLVGLRELGGLSGSVTSWLGRASILSGTGGQEVSMLEENLRAEVGRLVSGNEEWSKEEVRALGIYA